MKNKKALRRLLLSLIVPFLLLLLFFPASWPTANLKTAGKDWAVILPVTPVYPIWMGTTISIFSPPTAWATMSGSIKAAIRMETRAFFSTVVKVQACSTILGQMKVALPHQ
jgi:hypothetical protein